MTEALTQFITDTGWLAPIYYVGSFVITALVPIIPTPLVAALGGKAFGLLPAFAYGVFGLGIGSLIALNFARIVGQPLIYWLFRPGTLKRWENVLGIESAAAWGLFFFLFNLDFLVLISGLTTIRLKKLWVTAMIARLPWLAVSAWFGDAILISDTIMWVALLLSLPLLFLMTRIRPIIHNWLFVITKGRIPRI